MSRFRRYRTLLRIAKYALTIGLFLYFVGSLFGVLLGVLLLFGWFEYTLRRFRNHVQTLNAALRAVCARQGEIAEVARAMARGGPLADACDEYAMRLDRGEDPVESAVRSHVPLQLETAIALQSGWIAPTASADDVNRSGADRSGWVVTEAATIPVYGQFIYLICTAVITAAVMVFMVNTAAGSIVSMLEEFGVQRSETDRLTSIPTLAWLVLLVIIVLAALPLIQGRSLASDLPRWIPTMPAAAQRRADFLRGLAAGYEAGWPIGRSLAITHALSRRRSQRQVIELALRRIDAGQDPVDAMRRVGLLDSQYAEWLRGAPPVRSAQLLRTMSDQAVRDARWNLTWAMEILYPLCILAIGGTLLSFALVFFGSLGRIVLEQL